MENGSQRDGSELGGAVPRRDTLPGRNRAPGGNLAGLFSTIASVPAHLVALVVVVAMTLIWCLICGSIFSDWVLAVLEPKCQPPDSPVPPS